MDFNGVLFKGLFIIIIYQLFNSFSIVKSATTLKPKVKEEESGSTSGPPNCRKLLLVMGKRVKNFKTTCIRETRSKYTDPQDFQDHFQCAVKCYLQRLHMIDEGFKLSNETMAEFLTQVPDSYRALAWRVFTPCVIKMAPKIDPTDERCVAYGDLMKCLQEHASDKC